MSNSLGGMHLQESTIFDLDLGVKVTRNITQCPLHHVIFASAKFKVATSNGLGEDTITGNLTDRLWYKINITYLRVLKRTLSTSLQH